MGERPTPPDPFARKTGAPASEIKPSLSDALSGFAPKPIEDNIPSVMPVANIAPDTGRGGGRARRRGDQETRTKAINFRMKPREQAELNALCDELNRSIPDTIMILIENYRRPSS
jgi:hypothetical protein